MPAIRGATAIRRYDFNNILAVILSNAELVLTQLPDDSADMLQRILGEDVRLGLVLEPAVSPVVVDPGQMEQVLLDLVINARHAMPQGGTLTIRTCEVEVDEHDGAPGGRQARRSAPSSRRPSRTPCR